VKKRRQERAPNPKTRKQKEGRKNQDGKIGVLFRTGKRKKRGKDGEQWGKGRVKKEGGWS